MPSTEGIPQDVLVHILQHVPLTERMSTCSLVQQCWKDAAAAATTSIALKGMTAASATAIAAQLASSSTFWAKHITSISLEQHAVPYESLWEVVLQLACPKLQQLHLSGFILTPTAKSQSSSAGSGSADSQGLSLGCPLLQEVSLTSCWVETAECASIQSQGALSLLTALPALTKLHLGAIKVSVAAPGGGNHRDPNLRPLSALAGLQELSLEKPKAWQLQVLFRPSNQQQLLPSLTKLSILTDPGKFQYNSSTTPGLYELCSLRCLDLRGAEVGSVQQLSALSLLESLVLHSTTSLRVGNHVSDSNSKGCDDDLMGRDDPCVADTGELLQLLPQLTRLTSLDVFGLADSESLLAAAVPQWTCLGRCTGLQVLRLQNLFMHRDSWPLMFAGAQLNRLRELRLTIFYDFYEFHDDHSGVMPPQVVQQMVDACPNLKVLQLGGDGLLSNKGSPGNCMPEVRDCPPVSLAALAQLQHLTSLRVYSLRTQAFKDLWQLPQLRHLVVGGRVTDLALMQLSALTNLTLFRRLEMIDDSDERECHDDSVQPLALSQLSGLATPVCQQIVDYCRHNGWCEAVFQHGQGLGAQLAAAQLQVEEKDAEIALLKAHIAELEQQRSAGQA